MPTVQLRSRYLELLALIAASLAIWWRPIVLTVQVASSSDAHTHILLVLPLALALVWFETRRPGPSFTRGWAGVILLIAALLFRALAAWSHLSVNDRLSVSMFGLVIWWFGSVIVCLGLEMFRSLLFPLGFLLLLVPFPGGILAKIIEFLRNSSAWTTELLFRIVQVPVSRDGVLLLIPGLTIEVAQECSSIRSSMMLLLITLILAHLFLHSWWSKTLLVLAAIPMSVVKNAIRIFTIVELGTRVDPGFLYGRLHHNGGVLFLGLSILWMVLLLWLLRRAESGMPQHRTLQAQSWPDR